MTGFAREAALCRLQFLLKFSWCREAVAVMRLLAPMAFVVLCGCATQVGEGYWLRTDGGPLNGKQFEADRAACLSEVQKGGGTQAAAADALRACMTRRGYLQQLPQ
jgi:hypothetical protein